MRAGRYIVGDVVELLSGGPPMTARVVRNQGEGVVLDCDWFDDSTLRGGDFDPATLRLVGDCRATAGDSDQGDDTKATLDIHRRALREHAERIAEVELLRLPDQIAKVEAAVEAVAVRVAEVEKQTNPPPPDSALEFLSSMNDGDSIVCSCQCSVAEIAGARAYGRMYVRDDGIGYVLRRDGAKEG